MLTFEALLCSLADLQPWLQSSSSSSCVSFQSCFPAVFFFSPLFSSTFLLSPRPGVPLGTEAICGGGGRAAAEEQQADNRQQLSGGPLCGSVLLSTLGESRKEETFFSFFSFRFLCFFFLVFEALRENLPAESSRTEQEGTAETDKRREQEGAGASIVLLCLHWRWLTIRVTHFLSPPSVDTPLWHHHHCVFADTQLKKVVKG